MFPLLLPLTAAGNDVYHPARLIDGTIELGGVIHDVLEMDRDSTTPTALWLGRRMIGSPRQEAGTYREGGVSAS